VAQEHGGIFHVGRHHVIWSAVTGLIVAAGGVTLDEVFSEFFKGLGVHEFFVRYWPAGWDTQSIPVALGALIFAGCFFLTKRNRSEHQTAVNVTVNVGGGAQVETTAPKLDAEKANPVSPSLPRSIEGLYKGREDLVRRLAAALAGQQGGQSAIVALHGLGGTARRGSRLNMPGRAGNDIQQSSSPSATRRNRCGAIWRGSASRWHCRNARP
jgi:hypothetical protein